MSIKPLDLQASVPKSGEVGRVVKIQQDEGQARLSDVATSFRVQTEKDQRQVKTPPKAAGGRVERDGKRGRDRAEDQHREEGPDHGAREERCEEGVRSRDPRKGGLIDIIL